MEFPTIFWVWELYGGCVSRCQDDGGGISCVRRFVRVISGVIVTSVSGRKWFAKLYLSSVGGGNHNSVPLSGVRFCLFFALGS